MMASSSPKGSAAGATVPGASVSAANAARERWLIWICPGCGHILEEDGLPCECEGFPELESVWVVREAAVEQARAERDQWKSNHDGQVATKRRLSKRYGELVRALRFYADSANYIAPAIDDPDNSGDYMAPVDRDNGEKARAALEPATGSQAEPLAGEAREHIARMRESAVRVGELNDEIHGAVPSEGQGPTEANYIAACEYAARKLFDEGVLGDVSIPTAARLMAPVVQEVLAAVAGGRGEGRDG
jgi:hypothetical protein